MPEPTQSEHISDASFLGKLLALPANVRLDWKVIPSYKHSSFFDLVISDEGKKFYNIDPRLSQLKWCCKTFFSSSLMLQENKLHCLPLPNYDSLVLYLKVRPEPIYIKLFTAVI
jgi:hypothetical protein